MDKIRVGVLRGGVSDEYEISLRTGGQVLGSLSDEKYKKHDVLIDREGLWHLNGIPVSLEKLKNSIDVVFNSLHGYYGEDGKVQQILEQLDIPYTGSGPLAASMGHNKALSKEHFARLGVKTPEHVLLPAYQPDFDGNIEEYANAKARMILLKFPPPYVLKPLSGGSSMGIRIARNFVELSHAIHEAALMRASVIVEEFIAGKEAKVGVVENFRGEPLYALPPIEIRLPHDICPGNFTVEEKRALEAAAKALHHGFDLSHYSRADFILHPKRGIYAIGMNPLPGLTDSSLLPKALAAVGSSMPEFAEHIIGLALTEK